MIVDWGPALTTVATVMVALITWWAKKTPERTDPAEVMTDAYSRLAERVESLEDSNAKQWGVIQELRGKIDSLWSKLRKVVAYALELEQRVKDLGGEPWTRPPGVDDILDDQ